MTDDQSNSPAWLFSFVDLAFLLLIAMTQLAAEPGPELGEIVVPRIRAEATDDLAVNAESRWQLRVHPAVDATALPFELTRGDAREAADDRTETGLSRDAMRARLAALRASGAKKPVLAPHADSRSQDLLDAVAALDEQWPTRRRAAVARVFGDS